jgi:hypothetical protein
VGHFLFSSEFDMPAEALLINGPAIDFNTFLNVANKAIGYSPASKADASARKFSDAEKFLSCLASLRDQSAPAGVTTNLLSHLSYSVLVIADERDLIDVLEAAAGIPFVQAETTLRGVNIAVMHGTLAQWRDAVASGATPAAEPNVRMLFSKILVLFEKVMPSIWSDYTRKSAPDQTGFFLEYKRK